MKSFFLAPLLVLGAFLPSGSASESTVPAPQSAVLDHADGVAHGTVVVWDHYTTGRPTAHLRGTLYDEYGKEFAKVVARLEDWGGVTGYALTNFGYYSLRGGWFFDRYDEEGFFELAFDYGDTREVVFDGGFDGRRARWWTDWHFQERY
jgi:hypothetical protein